MKEILSSDLLHKATLSSLATLLMVLGGYYLVYEDRVLAVVLFVLSISICVVREVLKIYVAKNNIVLPNEDK